MPARNTYPCHEVTGRRQDSAETRKRESSQQEQRERQRCTERGCQKLKVVHPHGKSEMCSLSHAECDEHGVAGGNIAGATEAKAEAGICGTGKPTARGV